MKKLAAIPMLLLIVVALLFPVASLAFSADGYNVVLSYPTVAMAVITVVTLILSLMAISAKSGWFATLLAFLLPAFTALNCLFFIVEAPTVLTAILAVVCMLCVTVASISCRRGVISFLLIFVLALAPLGLVGYVAYDTATNPDAMIGSDPETILELASPEGGYNIVVSRGNAKIDDCDTYITLEYSEAPVNFVVGYLQRESTLVHYMPWENFELSGLKWIDEHTLLCDGNTYAISDEGAELIEAAAETAEAPVEEVSAEPTEAPAEETTVEEVVAEATEAPVEETTAEATEAPVAETTEETETTDEPELAGAVVTEAANADGL